MLLQTESLDFHRLVESVDSQEPTLKIRQSSSTARALAEVLLCGINFVRVLDIFHNHILIAYPT